MKRAAFVFALLAATPAHAWVHGINISVAPPSAPVLQNQTVNFGNLTRTTYGEVRLNSQDVTTLSVKPQTFSGLDLLTNSGTTCATWTMTFVSNSSSRPSTDFTIIAANTPEGSTAVTPQVASGGQDHLAGDYVWNVSCKDAGGNSSNTVNLTYHTVTAGGAGVVTFGNTDRLDFGAAPSTFGDVAGAEMQFATGGDWHASDLNIRFKSGAFTNQVLVKVADNTRRPYMSNIKGGGSMANYRITDFVLSGTLIGVTNNITGVSSSAGNTIHDAIMDNIHFYGSEPMLGNNSSQAAVFFGGCTATCGITDSSFDYVESGSAPTSNTYIRNTSFRYIYNNCLFLLSVDSVELSDVSCLSPMQRYQGQHPDNMQIADGATPSNITIQRFLEAQADGDYFAQGGPFAGTLIGVNGYVSLDTGSTSPGNVFTKTTGTVGSGWQGSTVVIPGVISASDNVKIDCSFNSHVCGAGVTKFTLLNLAATNIGSAGTPTKMYGAGTISFKMSGLLSSTAGPYGTSTNGNAGTSWIYDFDYASMDTQTPLISSFTGSVSGALLTATTQAVSNIPGNTGFITACGRINTGSGYTFNGSVNSRASGSDLGPGTYNLQGSPGNVSSQTIQCSGAYAGISVPDFQQSNCNLPDVQGGTYNVDRGLYTAGMYPHDLTSGCTVGVNFPAANTTFGASLFGATSHSYTPPGGNLTSADYASGMLPKDYLAAHTFTASDTYADILRINCLANKGKIGGKKDLGGGAWAGSVTGETNAGNHTGGGDWIIYNGSAHVTSTHITGCEAAP